MILDANKFDRVDSETGETDPNGDQFVAEASELRIGAPHEHVTLQNCPNPGQHRTFDFERHDWSGGDIAGWNYDEAAGPNRSDTHLKVLIIND